MLTTFKPIKALHIAFALKNIVLILLSVLLGLKATDLLHLKQVQTMLAQDVDECSEKEYKEEKKQDKQLPQSSPVLLLPNAQVIYPILKATIFLPPSIARLSPPPDSLHPHISKV